MALSIRDDVVFVTSENVAETNSQLQQIENALEHKRISSHRLAPDSSLPKNLNHRHPRVIVIDYLLDIYGTAVEFLNSDFVPDDTKILIWTDEPTLEVAVELMKLGASDYILSSAPKSVDKVINTIAQWLSQDQHTEDTSRRHRACIANSFAMVKTIELADSIAAIGTGIAFIFGEAGTGRNTIAREINRLRRKHHKNEDSSQIPSGLFELDWDLYCPDKLEYSLRSLIEATPHSGTIFIDHMDTDSGELIEELQNFQMLIEENSILVLLGFKDDSFRKLCTRLFPQSIQCELPPLNKRAEDVIPLINSILPDWQTKSFLHDSTFINQILSLDWPGNIHQLVSCLHESANVIKRKSTKKTAATVEEIFSAISAAHDRWIRLNHSQKTHAPSTLSVYRAYCKSGCSIRRTAAMLGISTRSVSNRISTLNRQNPEGAG